MLTLRFLGAPRVSDTAGSPIHSIEGSPKLLALLAYLATAPPGAPRRRDPTVALLWPRSDEAHARHALRQLLSRLRRLAGPHCLECDGVESLRLHPEMRSDVSALEAALAQDRLEAALDLYTGRFLDGVHVPGTPPFHRWMLEHREHLHGRMSDAARLLADRARDRGHAEAERRWLRTHLELDPYSKRSGAYLIESLLEAGEIGAALTVREHVVRRFENDLGLEVDGSLPRIRGRDA